MKKVLFIARNYKSKIKNGGNEVIKRNYQVLKEKYEVDEILLEFKLSPLEKLKDLITVNPWGFTSEIKKQIESKIKREKYDFIWIDNSLYGGISKFIKKIDKDLKIITFFHNIEYEYFKDKCKVDGIINYIMLPYSYINEKRTIRYSDKIIVLNNRDSDKLQKIYSRKADIVIPLTLEDKYKEEYEKFENEKSDKRMALFVGSNFFANVQGINWFVENVLPELGIELHIVGQGMEFLREKYKGNLKVVVKGFVEDIGLEYAKADFVVAPIFHGSGMKTKTTEALMYGKKIFGTTEAFEGFELDFEKVGGLCNSKEDFKNSIKNFENSKFNEYSREIYLTKYSNNSVKKIIGEI